jgi:hypothetical protein
MADEMVSLNGTIEKAIVWEKEHRNLKEIIEELNKRLVVSEKARGGEIENIANLTEKLNSLEQEQLTLTGARLIATNKEIKVIQDKINKLKELGIEQEKQTRAQIERANSIRENYSPSTGMSSIDTSKIDFKGSHNGIAGIQNAIAKATDIANKKQEEQIEIVMRQRDAWANLGATTSDAMAQSISGGQTLLQSLSKITGSIINQLEQITLARMVANSSKFGIGGILAAAAGFGIVKGIFGKLSKENSQSTYSSPIYGSTNARANRVEVYGRFEMSGKTAVALVKSGSYSNAITG